METMFLREAPNRIDVSEGNVYFSWRDGREIIMPLKECRVSEARLQRALRDHDARSAEVIQLPKRGNGHAASP